jgi:hypothetical protein
MKMLSSVAALLLFTGGAIAQPAPPTSGGSPATPAMPEATQPSTPPEAIPSHARCSEGYAAFGACT